MTCSLWARLKAKPLLAQKISNLMSLCIKFSIFFIKEKQKKPLMA